MVNFQIFANTALLQSTKAGSSSLIQYTYSWTKAFLGPLGRLQPAAPKQGPTMARLHKSSDRFLWVSLWNASAWGWCRCSGLARGENLKGKKKKGQASISLKKKKKCWTIPLEKKQQGSWRGGEWIQQGTSRGEAEKENEGRKSDTAPKCPK